MTFEIEGFLHSLQLISLICPLSCTEHAGLEGCCLPAGLLPHEGCGLPHHQVCGLSGDVVVGEIHV